MKLTPDRVAQPSRSLVATMSDIIGMQNPRSRSPRTRMPYCTNAVYSASTFHHSTPLSYFYNHFVSSIKGRGLGVLIKKTSYRFTLSRSAIMIICMGFNPNFLLVVGYLSHFSNAYDAVYNADSKSFSIIYFLIFALIVITH